METGSTLYIREGNYHEVITVGGIGNNNVSGQKTVITNYQNEKVVIDGTETIQGNWEQHAPNIYKLTLDEAQAPVWQLFVDGTMQVPARWPNGNTNPTEPLEHSQNNEYEAKPGTWWSKSTTWANADGNGTSINVDENGMSICQNVNSHFNIFNTEASFTGGRIIYSFLAQGGDGNQERRIESHLEGSKLIMHKGYSGPGTKKGYATTGKYFIIEDLQVLDQKHEWFYTPEDKTIYLWVAPDQDIHSMTVKGRTMTRGIRIENDAYNVTFKGINLYACNFIVEGKYISIEDAKIEFPDASRRMLNEFPNESIDAVNSYGTLVTGKYFTMRNCEYAYSELGLKFSSGEGALLENNHIHHISMWGVGKQGAIEFVNTFRRNTYHTGGVRGGIKTNTNPEISRIQSYNLIKEFGYMQVSDGAGLQVNPARQPGTVRHHNWFLNAPKYGSRFDGFPGGTGATNHHNVGKNVRGALQVKGDGHFIYNNTCFDGHPERNDIIILSDPNYGGNSTTITQNNLADRMSGDRSQNLTASPLPGTHGFNWNGYSNSSAVSDWLEDPESFDFRPKASAPMVDAGKQVAGITDGFIGAAPDIGAYEYGDTVYWIPGHQTAAASFPIPRNGSTKISTDRDLIFLHGYKSTQAHVYLGTDKQAVANATTSSPEFKMIKTISNIINTAELNLTEHHFDSETTYYWRIDAIDAHGNTTKGDIWEFSTVNNLNIGKLPSEQEGFQLFPNPVKGQLHIKGKNKITEIQIYSITGKIVNTTEHSTKEVILTFAGWDSGVYIAKINGVHTYKIIVQ